MQRKEEKKGKTPESSSDSVSSLIILKITNLRGHTQSANHRIHAKQSREQEASNLTRAGIKPERRPFN